MRGLPSCGSGALVSTCSRLNIVSHPPEGMKASEVCRDQGTGQYAPLGLCDVRHDHEIRLQVIQALGLLSPRVLVLLGGRHCEMARGGGGGAGEGERAGGGSSGVAEGSEHSVREVWRAQRVSEAEVRVGEEDEEKVR